MVGAADDADHRLLLPSFHAGRRQGPRRNPRPGRLPGIGRALVATRAILPSPFPGDDHIYLGV